MILGSRDLDPETWAALVEESILLEGTANDIKIIGNNNISLGNIQTAQMFNLYSKFLGWRGRGGLHN